MSVPVHKYLNLVDGELENLLGQIENEEKLGWELYLIAPESWGSMSEGDGGFETNWQAVMRTPNLDWVDSSEYGVGTGKANQPHAQTLLGRG